MSSGPPRVALVNPPSGVEGEPWLPIGLSYVIASARRSGFSVDALDFSGVAPERWLEALSELGAHQYDLLGFTVYNETFLTVLEAARYLKRAHPRQIIVIGGPHSSDAHRHILSTYKSIDAAFIKEAEISFPRFLQQYEDFLSARANSHANPVELPGVAYRTLDGEVVIGPDPGRVDDFANLAYPLVHYKSTVELEYPDYFDPVLRKRKLAYPMITSRSCPFDCNFCAIINIGRQWRARSAESVVAELRAAEEFSGKRFGHVYLMDANFFVRPRRSLDISTELKRYDAGSCPKSELTFSFSTRADQLIHGRKVLKDLQRNGLRFIEIGFESGSDSALNRFRKRCTVAQNETAIRILRGLGIRFVIDFIMFDPESDLQTLQENVDFFRRNHLMEMLPQDVIRSHMKIYLGTSLRQELEARHGWNLSIDWVPRPEPLFVDLRVRWIFERFVNEASRWLSIQHSFIDRVAEMLRGDVSPGTHRVLTTLGVRVRRYPFMLLQALISMARSFEAPVLNSRWADLPAALRHMRKSYRLIRLEVLDAEISALEEKLRDWPERTAIRAIEQAARLRA